MAFFANHSWNFIEKLEIYIGFWPRQKWFESYCIRIITILVLTVNPIPIVSRMDKEWGVNLNIVTENIISIMIVVSTAVKFIMTCIYNKERQKIYEKVNDHFSRIIDPEEVFLLKKRAEDAKKLCSRYLILFYATFIIFWGLPMGKMLFDAFINGSELEKVIPYYADYDTFIDYDKYYGLIMLKIIVSGISGIINNAAHDCAFIMNVRHVNALFDIVKIRLKEASGYLKEYDWKMLDFVTADKKATEFITQSVDLHNEALEMTTSINRIYRFTIFVISLESVFVFSGGVYLLLLNLDEPFNLLRYFTFFITIFVHFIIPFLHGQMIIDSSSSVFDSCYNVKWYLASPKTRRLLLIMMLRSSRPSEITGGGFFIMCMETCRKMMKGGYSYLSVFTSRMHRQIESQ